MHLVINATDIGRRRGGNESYLLGLLEGLDRLKVRSKITLLLGSAGVEALPGAAAGRFPFVSVGDYRRLLFFIWQQTAALRRLRPDWYLSTFFLPPITSCRAAVLVHDLSFRAHPEYFPKFIACYMRILTGLAIRQAERVIALSDFTRRELDSFYPAAVAKTVVVPPGVRQLFHPRQAGDDGVLQPYGLAPGYILALGNIHPRKNLGRLLDAYLDLRQRRAGLPPMVWVGLPRWSSGKLLARARSAGVVLPGFVAQRDLPALFRNALMFVYPSLYEGFGLPPLEAMACGTPVVASDTTGLPEAVGEAALQANPTDVHALASAMERLLDDPSLRRRLRRAGLERTRRFTWTQSAHKLLAALRLS
jgi:glycosyltransferase involved in cell wall biosynthesis